MPIELSGRLSRGGAVDGSFLLARGSVRSMRYGDAGSALAESWEARAPLST
jgi:hypothetical protein